MLKEEYVHVRVLKADLLMVSYVEKWESIPTSRSVLEDTIIRLE